MNPNYGLENKMRTTHNTKFAGKPRKGIAFYSRLFLLTRLRKAPNVTLGRARSTPMSVECWSDRMIWSCRTSVGREGREEM
jgi:hypothetical protein